MFANTVEKDHLRCENLTPYSEWISTLQYTEITYKNYPFPQLIITVGVKVLQDTILFFYYLSYYLLMKVALLHLVGSYLIPTISEKW